jgi:6-methylsalicylate decarboxylase
MSTVLDFHHHVTPPEYVKQMEKHGVTGNTGVKFKKFDPGKNLKIMSKAKIDKAFLSISTPGVYVKNDKVSAHVARISNEYIAAMKRDHPNRYGGFAALPYPGREESLKELEYAYETLNLDGVALMSNVQGTYLGEAGYDELFSELNKRKAIVFIHPNDILIDKGPYIGITGTLEWVIDTTRAAYNLYLNGYLEKYKEIRYVLSHGGGALPVLASKIVKKSLRKESTTISDKTVEDNMNLLRRFYFDTAQRGNEILSGLHAFCGGDQVVFGSDMPYQPPFEILAGQKELKAFNGFNNHQKENIFSGINLGLNS